MEAKTFIIFRLTADIEILTSFNLASLEAITIKTITTLLVNHQAISNHKAKLGANIIIFQVISFEKQDYS